MAELLVNNTQNMKQVQVYLKFKSTENVDPSVEDFIEMLQAINDCHNVVMSLSQNEYKGLHLPRRASIIDNHKLKISTIKRENPFIVDFVFNIDPEQLIEFLKLLKMCFLSCRLFKTYAVDLIEELLRWLRKQPNFNERSNEKNKLMQEALKKEHLMNEHLNRLCNCKFKIIDLFYNFGGEIFKIIENEEYKRED
jgi:hypothetical protein